jgi:hypothetical protein
VRQAGEKADMIAEVEPSKKKFSGKNNTGTQIIAPSHKAFHKKERNVFREEK